MSRHVVRPLVRVAEEVAVPALWYDPVQSRLFKEPRHVEQGHQRRREAQLAVSTLSHCTLTQLGYSLRTSMSTRTSGSAFSLMVSDADVCLMKICPHGASDEPVTHTHCLYHNYECRFRLRLPGRSQRQTSGSPGTSRRSGL